MKTKILPYTYIDGIPTLKDSEILQIYRWMKNDKTLERVLYNVDYRIVTEDFFMRFWKRKDMKMFIIIYDSRIGGLLWIDRIVDFTAMIHFNAFRWTWGGDNIKIFKDAVFELFNLTKIDALVGQMPVNNRLAIEFSKKVGFSQSGIIPRSLYLHHLNKKVDAYVCYAIKEIYCREYLASNNKW